MLAGYRKASDLISAYRKAEAEAFPDNPTGPVAEPIMRRFHNLNAAYVRLQQVGHNAVFGDKQ